MSNVLKKPFRNRKRIYLKYFWRWSIFSKKRFSFFQENSCFLTLWTKISLYIFLLCWVVSISNDIHSAASRHWKTLHPPNILCRLEFLIHPNVKKRWSTNVDQMLLPRKTHTDYMGVRGIIGHYLKNMTRYSIVTTLFYWDLKKCVFISVCVYICFTLSW